MTLTIHSDWDALSYEHTHDWQVRHALNELPKLTIKPETSILDIGCGDGKITNYLAHHWPTCKITAVDNDANMIAMAQKSYPECSFYQADISELDTSATYNAIVSFWCLHWVRDYDTALQNIAALLTPSGKALLCHVYDAYPLDVYAARLLQSPKWNTYASNPILMANPPKLEIIIAAIRKSNLQVRHLELKNIESWFEVGVFKEALISTPLYDAVPWDRRAEFIDDLLSSYFEDYPLDENGQMLIIIPTIVMVLKH